MKREKEQNEVFGDIKTMISQFKTDRSHIDKSEPAKKYRRQTSPTFSQ